MAILQFFSLRKQNKHCLLCVPVCVYVCVSAHLPQYQCEQRTTCGSVLSFYRVGPSNQTQLVRYPRNISPAIFPFSYIYMHGVHPCVCMHIHMHEYKCKQVCAQVCAHAGEISQTQGSLIWTVSTVTFQGWNYRRATVLIWHLYGFEESKFLSSRLLASALVAGLVLHCGNSIFQRYN